MSSNDTLQHVHSKRGCHADQWQSATFCTHFNYFQNHKFHFNNSIDSIFWARYHPPLDAIQWAFKWKAFNFENAKQLNWISCSMLIGVLELCANIWMKWISFQWEGFRMKSHKQRWFTLIASTKILTQINLSKNINYKVYIRYHSSYQSNYFE